MKKIPLLALAGMLAACSGDSPESTENANLNMNAAAPAVGLEYPQTRRGQVVDTYFDTRVADPYRWLEDDRSEETGAWVQAQNKVTFGYLEQIPYRDKLRERLKVVWNYEKVGSPFREGNYTYFYRNDGLQDQYVVWRKQGDGEPEVFLDPNKFSEDGTTSLASLEFSRDGSIAAYSISEGGSDWRKIIIVNAETGEILEEPLVDVKFSGISWRGNEGFYYSSYDKPEGSELSARTDQHKLYYHKLGQPQSEDRLVFGGEPQQKRRYVSGYVTEDDRYLVISGSKSTSGNDLYIRDLSEPDAPLVTVLDHFDSDTYVLENVGSKLYLVTNLDAPNKKIVTVDAADPVPANWRDLIAETDNVLSASTGGGYIFTRYMVDALSRVYQYDLDGERIREIELPGPGSASSLGGKKDDEVLYYTFTNYKTPGTIFAFDVEEGQSEIYRESGADFDSSAYQSEQVFYTSRDGTRIPMMITYKKGLELDGKNPTILYGYGGFNISLTPYFKIANAVWLEMGGIYAVPNLRGGGEYGKRWHNAGTKLQKQNVFDDFIAAAEYLTEKKYTSRDYLAIHGGSNGGLLVGAVATQRPELVKVALPAVGVMDMLRYHTFTAGAGWAYDYGTAEESEEMFKYLKGYSPVHNVRAGVEYPATLVTTADHDDRVVPAHSFKFAAELQSKQAGTAPTLIRIETKAGHGAGTPVSKSIEQYADIFSFTLFNMGFAELPN
ncbi:prolyl oligopeptidase family serine peptidase [Microbulbifer taiwanensis]|uniref:prolyl oligopeptidase n=1 Tax=Microbulbifer taiwanensis TaxID=986746 RepID=A0ABW1YL57_9GAMM|nr:prolyl oligopeptidase family serine peptidase [Microbulbifer taiwanensis]